MATYLELLEKKRELDERIEQARAEAAAEALAAARAAIVEFGFTPDDLFGKAQKKAASRANTKRLPNGPVPGRPDRSTTLDLFASNGADDAE